MFFCPYLTTGISIVKPSVGPKVPDANLSPHGTAPWSMSDPMYGMYGNLSSNFKLVPVGNAAAIGLSGLGGLTPLSSNSFFVAGGVTPPVATAFPVCIAPAPLSPEKRGVMVLTRMPGHVFPKRKAPARNADPKRIAFIFKTCFLRKTKALARNADPRRIAF